MIQYEFALDENGNVVHITQAEKGKKYKCANSLCGRLMIVKKGEIREHHFAHYAVDIVHKGESILHYNMKCMIYSMIKKRMEDKKGLNIVSACTCGNVNKENILNRAVEVKMEALIGSVVPDILIVKKDELIAIEVIHRNPLEDEKRSYYKANNIRLLEIDAEDYEKIYSKLNSGEEDIFSGEVACVCSLFKLYSIWLDKYKFEIPKERQYKLRAAEYHWDYNEVVRAFPFKNFLEYQDEVISRICKNFNNGKRVVLLQAPVAFGKSGVNLAFASISRDAFITTPQKILQDQYEREFKNRVAVIKGRNNYLCKSFNYKVTCDYGLCKLKKGYKCKFKEDRTCEYWRAKMNAMNHKVALMNTAYLFTDGMLESGGFENRRLLIVDEGHNVSDDVLNMISITFSSRTVPKEIWENIKIPQCEDIIELIKFLWYNVMVKIVDRKNALDIKDKLTEDELKEKEKLDSLIFKYRVVVEDLKKKLPWIYKIEDNKIVMQPVFVGESCWKYLWSRADYFIISSATILDKEFFMKENGLMCDKNKVVMIDVPGIIPVDRRPIVKVYAGKMTEKFKNDNIDKAVEIVKRIMNKHSNEKGIIHCHSYENSEMIKNLIDKECLSRMIFHDSMNRSEKLKEWLNRNDNSVLVSVGMEEGLDLKYDKCRFQILFKVPYLDINDERVKYRLEKLKDWKWYNLMALRDVIQAYGRAVRAKDDYAIFYVIDASFDDLIAKTDKYIPKWFREAVENAQIAVIKEEIKEKEMEIKEVW